MGQIILLPTDLEELIPENHLVRVVNKFIEEMDMGVLEGEYKGGGTSSYHPKMMLKVYVYAYTQKIFSSRRIAKALRESIPFMWLSGNSHPDFRTINHFRGHILKGHIQEIFTAVLMLLIEGKYIKLEEYFVDGTKMEANANRYSYVWAKSTEHYQKQLVEKVARLFEEIEMLNAGEDERYGGKELDEIGESAEVTPERLAQRVAELNKRLGKKSEPEQSKEEGAKNEPPQEEELLSTVIEEKLEEIKQNPADEEENKVSNKAAQQLEKECLPRAQKYEAQQNLLAGRNSYSKTDPDATFMRMKDDHLGNGQLRAAYNMQIGTEDQFVVGFSVHQEAGDTTCLIPHMEQLRNQIGCLPEKVTSDAGYGSEENYSYLESEKVGNFLKYSFFDREQKKRFKPNVFKVEYMPYDPEKDEFICPNAKRLKFLHTSSAKTKNGFQVEHRHYACQECTGCPLKQKCTKAAGDRQIKVSFRQLEFRKQARENLCSDVGLRLRSQRGVDVEAVFGRIKECWGFRRFLLRGLEKVSAEWGLLCLAHNLAKVWSTDNEKRLAII